MDEFQIQQLLRKRAEIDEELALRRERRRIDEMLARPPPAMQTTKPSSRETPISLDSDEEDEDRKTIKQEARAEAQPTINAPIPPMPSPAPSGVLAGPHVHGDNQARVAHSVPADETIPVALQQDMRLPQRSSAPAKVQQQEVLDHPAAYRDIATFRHHKFTTLVQKGDGTGWYELRCCHCGGNFTRHKHFVNGVPGLRVHIRACHEEKFPSNGLTDRKIVETCTVGELNNLQVSDMARGKKTAYQIPEKPLALMPAGATVHMGRPKKAKQESQDSPRRSTSSLLHIKPSKASRKRPRASSDGEYDPREGNEEDETPRSGMSKATLESAKKLHRRG